MTWFGATAWRSTRAASGLRLARPAAVCGSRRTVAIHGQRRKRGCPRSPPCASPQCDTRKKASKDSEAGAMPDDALIAAMTKYNEEMAKAGILLDLAGLNPARRAHALN